MSASAEIPPGSGDPVELAPGSGMLGRGFDVSKTYDENASNSLQNLFALDVPSILKFSWGNKSYVLPENANYDPLNQSSISFSMYTSREELANHFAAAASISGSYASFEGELSVSFESAATHSSTSFYAVAEYDTLGYQLAIISPTIANLTQQAQDAIQRLPKEFNSDTALAFFTFFSTFGAYFVRSVSTGGRLAYSSSVSQQAATNLTSASAQAKAAWNGLTASAKGSASADWKQVTSNFFAAQQIKVRGFGGVIPPALLIPPEYGENRGDAIATWSTSVPASPSLVQFGLMPVYGIVSPEMRPTLQSATEAYIASRLDLEVSTGRVGSIYLGSKVLFQGVKPTSEAGCGAVVVLNRKDLSVALNQQVYFTPSGQPRYAANMDDLSKAIAGYIGSENSNQYIVVVMMWGGNNSFINHPDETLHGYLKQLGAGQGLAYWDHHNSDSSGTVQIVYALVGIPGSGTGDGVEGYATATYPASLGPHLDSEIYLLPSVLQSGISYSPK